MRLRRQALLLVALLVVLTAAAACEVVKSETPLSPSVAGPIAGVSITAPTLLDPINNKRFKAKEQPITLSLQNATSTGVRPLYYRFEVASDDTFANPLFANPNVSPGSGSTSVRLPDALPTDKVYYWRARAEDGANTGPYSISAFVVLPPVVINAPVPVEPIGGAKVNTSSPVLRVNNARWSGPIGAITYRFELSTDSGFGSLVGSATVAEGVGQTTWTAGGVGYNKTFYWRVQASDPDAISPWSAVESFATGTLVPTPSPGGCSPAPPWPTSGPAIIERVKACYPSYLAAGISSDQRRNNMAFLRDKIIENGICGGMDLGWNLKRGGPELSVDFLAMRRGADSIGIDLAFDYDNTSNPLQLQWLDTGPGAFYATYTPRPSCR